jgi:hypothetical protein
VSEAERIASSEKQGSRMIFEAILDIVTARGRIAAYRETLLRFATDIHEKRGAAAAEEASRKTPRPVLLQSGAKPATKREALETALAMLGIGAEIVGEMQTQVSTHFTVKCGEQTTRIPVSNEVMASDDPVKDVMGILSCIRLVTSEADVRKMELERRRSCRPSTEPTGIATEELDGRMITFDGIQDGGDSQGQFIFTYTAQGVETTFNFPAGVTGEELLAQIDERIDAVHAQFKSPYPAEVIEWRARGNADRPHLAGLAGEPLKIAWALEYLASCPQDLGQLVPPEFREGFYALKKLDPPRTAYLTAEGKAELDAAFEGLDHPAGSLLREIYRSGRVMLDEAAQAEAKALLQAATGASVDYCDAAIANISDAFSLLPGDSLGAVEAAANPRQHYFRMAFHLRRAVDEAIRDGTLEVDS